jgi:uncharacterized protein YybS (DUF2232 family)
MTLPGEGTPSHGSYWSRYVPLSMIAVALGALLAMVPLINSLILVAVPALLLALAGEREEGRSERWLPPLIAAGLVGSVDLSGGLVALVMAATAIVLDETVRRGLEWRRTIVAAALPTAAVLAFPLVVLDRQVLRDQLLGVVEPTFRSLSGMGYDEAALRAEFTGFFDTALRLLPSLFVLTALGVAALALGIGLWWLHRRGRAGAFVLPPVSMWVFPDGLRWLTGLGLAGALAAHPLNLPVAVETTGLNLLVAAGTVWSVQGFSIVWYGFIVRNTSAILKALFIFLIIISTWLGLAVLALLGVVERWIPFRALMAEGSRANEENEEEY